VPLDARLRRETLSLVLAAFPACQEPTTDASSATSSTGSTPTTSSSTSSAASADASGGETGGDSLCATGSEKQWCFEVVRGTHSGQPVDYDRDGLSDLISFGSAAGELSGKHALGNPVGSFETIWELEFDFTWTTILGLVDDGDVRRMLVSSGSGSDPNGPIFSYEISGLQAPVLVDEYADPRDWPLGRLVVAHIDDDNVLDFVAIAEAQPYLRVWLGDGAGGFSPQPEIMVVDAVYNFFAGADAADMDGDGATDLVFDDASLGGPTVYFGDGSGQFPEHTVIDVESGGNIHARDIDGDGRSDVLFATASGFVAAFSEGRSFRSVVFQLGETPFLEPEVFRFVPVDLDLDGSVEVFGYHKDLIDGDLGNGTYETRIHVFSGANANGFADESTLILDASCLVPGGTYPSDVLELDGDGHPDLLVQQHQECPGLDDVRITLGLMYRP